MKIKILNKLKKIQHITINKKTLKNYTKLNKNTYIRKELYQKFYKKKQKPYQTIKGTTELTNKKYTRYTFKLYRTPINTSEQINKFFIKIISKYKLIQRRDKKYPVQRIGINIASDPKEYRTYTNKKTKRQNTKEQYDFISTSTWRRRGQLDNEGMFIELEQKITNYSLEDTYKMILEGERDKKAKEFFVIFTQE